MKTRFALSILIFSLLAGCRAAQEIPRVTPTADPSTAVIDPEFVVGAVSPRVFGVNHGPWAILTTKVYPQAVETGFGMIRFPGGNWGDLNTMTEREVEYIASVAADLGAELSISVRLTGGTPEVAADLVRMANQELGLDVRYWSIGNEPGLYDDYDTVRYNEEWRAIAEAMLEVDPDLILIGPEVTQFTGNPASDPRDENGLYWVDEFLKYNGDLVDIVSIHRYPFPRSMAGEPTTVAELYGSRVEWDRIIPALREKVLELTGEEKPLAVTEVNSHWSNVLGQQASPDSFANAIWWGDVLTRLILEEVEIVTYFSLQSSSSIGSYGLFERSGKRPSFYVYEMYRHFGDRLIYASSPDDEVTLAASLCPDGDVSLIAVNATLEGKELPLLINGIDGLPNTKTLLLAKDRLAEEIEVEEVWSGGVMAFPPESMIAVTFSVDELYCGIADVDPDSN